MSTTLADALLERAVALRASDVHVDPGADGFRVRLRVDGRFLEEPRLDRASGLQLLGRLKVLSSLMVYRSDVPQEGRLPLPGAHEARLAVIPTPLGEKATLRLFDAEARLAGLADLGFAEEVAGWLEERLARPSGLLLAAGPSGSGKTTTLYAGLAEVLARRGAFCQVVTVEDPVERRIEGAVQVQVDAARDLDFASALKFLLRQDPEVILVGEIRDPETARVAVRAAMTGHLVLSSLHCGRAHEARPRLLEMGVEPWAVDLALSGVLAQRLVRLLCTACRGEGCEECLSTGYKGRTAVAEVLDPGQPVPRTTLAAAARALVSRGVTTDEEVHRVLGGES